MTAPSNDRTYEPALLTDLDPASEDFARTWVRTLLRDVPEVKAGGVPIGAGQPTRPSVSTWPEFSRTDTQINAALALDAVRGPNGDGTDELIPYYRPHFTAARLYLGDPNLWKSRAVDGSSESRRDSREIINAWLAQGAALDAMIPSGVVLPPFETAAVTEATRQAPERPAAIVINTGGGGW